MKQIFIHFLLLIIIILSFGCSNITERRLDFEKTVPIGTSKQQIDASFKSVGQHMGFSWYYGKGQSLGYPIHRWLFKFRENKVYKVGVCFNNLTHKQRQNIIDNINICYGEPYSQEDDFDFIWDSNDKFISTGYNSFSKLFFIYVK